MKVKNNFDGISVIIPAFGDIKTVSNSVWSCMKQQLGKLNEPHPKLEIIIMNDDIDNPDCYDEFLSDEYKKFYDSENITVKIIHNKDYMTDDFKLYQGGSRLIGATEIAKYTFVLFLDSDDILAPNCVRKYWDIIQDELVKENNPEKKEEFKKIACIGAIFRSFDSHHYQNDIGKEVFSIWVQGRCWNSDFMIEHNITDDTIYTNRVNRKQGEDYLFVNIFDYCCEHEENEWRRIQTKDFICGFWIPNYDSLSRNDPYYGQHLAGSTMNSSNCIFDFMEKYNKEHNIDKEQDEFMKRKLLNMNIYAFFNLYDFIWVVGATNDYPIDENDTRKPYKPLEQDWYLLRDNIKKLRQKLLDIYYDEIQDNDIVNEYWGVLNRSDARIHNTFEGNFFDYMRNTPRWFDYDYDQMIEEAHKLKFDGLNCLQSKQVQAWKRRHN